MEVMERARVLFCHSCWIRRLRSRNRCFVGFLGLDDRGIIQVFVKNEKVAFFILKIEGLILKEPSLDQVY